MIFNVPNIVSISRILFAPVFYIMFLSKDPIVAAVSCPLFLLGALSDWFDGWYARKYNVESKWGIFIDPLADKFLTTAAFIAYSQLGVIPMWMVIVIIVRDFGTTFLRLFADSHKETIVTSNSAKLKTFLQFAFLAYIQVFYFAIKLEIFPDATLFFYELIFSDISYYMMLALTLFTVWTLIEYILDNKRIVYKLFGSEISNDLG